jgi:ubiquitin-protein ligase
VLLFRLPQNYPFDAPRISVESPKLACSICAPAGAKDVPQCVSFPGFVWSPAITLDRLASTVCAELELSEARLSV